MKSRALGDPKHDYFSFSVSEPGASEPQVHRRNRERDKGDHAGDAHLPLEGRFRTSPETLVDILCTLLFDRATVGLRVVRHLALLNTTRVIPGVSTIYIVS